MNTTLYWLRHDLRLSDNPALSWAAERGDILPVYIRDTSLDTSPGAASNCWLQDSLEKLDMKMSKALRLFAGDAKNIIPQLLQETNIKTVVWNRLFEPETIARDSDIKRQLIEQGIEVKSFNANLLWQPTEVLKKDGTPYKVFTPYYRRGCLAAAAPRYPLAEPQNLQFFKGEVTGQISLEELKLLPEEQHIAGKPWDEIMMAHWQPGEDAAKSVLRDFLQSGPIINAARVLNYKDDRNLPAIKGTSRLSPYLHFGEISPNQVWYAVLDACANLNVTKEQAGVDCYLSELGWREFSAYLLYHFPDIPTQNFNRKFDHFPWLTDDAALTAWQTGQTGIPIVDAGMRELYTTGYMHNRVRMIVGSFLVKNLLINWREGEKWFWDCLVDADLASNVASWQWVAGSGADAAPYFRIFNPVTQGQKFDPEGKYIKKWCPELAKLPPKIIHNWWEAKPELLSALKFKPGQNYPNPIVDLKPSRQRALDAFAKIRAAESHDG